MAGGTANGWVKLSVSLAGEWFIPSITDPIFRFTAFSLPGQVTPWSKSANRTLPYSLSETFAPWPFRSLAFSLPGTFAPCSKMARELLFPGIFALKSIRSQKRSLPGTYMQL